MGMVATRMSDLVFVTSDNPRSEPPEAIIEEILRGITPVQRANVRVVPDRRDAILAALGAAEPGDAVVIAGKGHETTQSVRDKTLPFDDRVVAREALRSLEGRSRS
jgi:UDP-N-acetylmuramoyl-L-alanyl-D-glutamate--2,6-diaminopimelate ligase